MLQFRLPQHELWVFFQFQGVHRAECHGEAEQKKEKMICTSDYKLNTLMCLNLSADNYLHSNSLEESWVSKRQLYHFFDLGELFPDPSNVIVTHLIQRLFLILQTGVQTHSYTLFLHKTHFKPWQNLKHLLASLLIGSPSQWITVSGATIQYGLGSVSTTLNSTARIPPLTRKISPMEIKPNQCYYQSRKKKGWFTHQLHNL